MYIVFACPLRRLQPNNDLETTVPTKMGAVCRACYEHRFTARCYHMLRRLSIGISLCSDKTSIHAICWPMMSIMYRQIKLCVCESLIHKFELPMNNLIMYTQLTPSHGLIAIHTLINRSFWLVVHGTRLQAHGWAPPPHPPTSPPPTPVCPVFQPNGLSSNRMVLFMFFPTK